MRRGPALIAILAAASFALVASAARAQGAPPQVPGLPGADEVDEPEGRVKPYAEDFRTGHVYIDAIASALFPVGDIAPGSSLTEVSSFGFIAGGALGVGLSRHVELDVRGGYGLLSSPTECADCSSDVATASLGFTHHLTNGAAFDPWIRLGTGYRTFSVEHGAAESSAVLEIVNGRYHGVDIAQLSLGADFFPVPGFGFGPWLEADMGTFVAWPDGSREGTRFYAFFQVGLEIELDPVQWTEDSKPAPAPAPPAAAPPSSPPPAAAAFADVPRF